MLLPIEDQALTKNHENEEKHESPRRLFLEVPLRRRQGGAHGVVPAMVPPSPRALAVPKLTRVVWNALQGHG